MRFTCPGCTTIYDMPDGSFEGVAARDGQVRKMRCVRCGAVFSAQVEWLLSTARADNAGENAIYVELRTPPAGEVPATAPAAEAGTPRVKLTVDRDAAKGLPASANRVKSGANWTVDNILELDDYALDAFAVAARRKHRFFIGMLVLIVGFFVFVASKNNWTIEVNRFSRQVKKAFGLESAAEKQERLLEQVIVHLEDGYPVRQKGGKVVGVITGTVENQTLDRLENVELEGRLFGPGNQLIKTVRFSCGQEWSDKRLAQMGSKRLIRIMKRRQEELTCAIGSGYTVKFKAVFPDLPRQFGKNYQFKVVPVAARKAP